MTRSSGIQPGASSACAPTLAGCIIAATMLGTSVLGIAGTFTMTTLLIMLLAASAAGIAVGRQSHAAPLPKSPWLLSLLILVAIPAAIAFLPPHTWDEYAYSVSLPRDYANAGRFFYQADYGPYSAFPGNYEALTTTSLALLNSVSAVKLLNIILAAGMAIIAMRFSRKTGVPDRFAFIAALLVMTSPSLAMAVTVAKNDVANAFFQAISVLAFVRYLRTQRAVDLALSSVFLAVALGIKYNSLQFALCFFAGAAAVALRMPAPRKRILRDALIALAVLVLAASPWYVRNLMEFGNPLFPFYNDIFKSANDFTPLHSKITQEMFWGLSHYNWHSGTLSDFFSKYFDGFGVATSLLVLPGLILAFRRIHDPATLFLVVVFIIYAGFIMRFGFWEPRYSLVLLVFAAGFAALALAEGLVFLERRVPNSPVTFWLSGSILILLVGWGLYQQYDIHKHTLHTAASTNDDTAFCSKTVAYWDLVEWINSHLGKGDKIAIGVNIQPFFYIEKPYLHIHPMTEKGNLQNLETSDQYLDAFKSMEITMLAYAPADLSQFYPRQNAPLMYDFLDRLHDSVQELATRGDLEIVHRIHQVTIYQLRFDKTSNDL